MTVTFEAKVPTEHSRKYSVQLCKHWCHKLEVESGQAGGGTIRFPDAVVTLRSGPATLDITVEAETAETAARTRKVVEDHIDRFAFRETPLTYAWK